MSITRRLWIGLGTLLIVGFSILLWMGTVIHRQAPPMPDAVVTTAGDTVYTRADIELGRQVWQSIGGQQLGSIWGHGALVAPDWTADWLHREAVAWLDLRARSKNGSAYGQLDAGEQARGQAELRPLIRSNTFDAASNTIVIPPQRAQAMAQVAAHALENGYWYARSAEFMGKPLIHVLVWMRVPGDTVFSIGALLMAWVVFRLWVAPKREPLVGLPIKPQTT